MRRDMSFGGHPRGVTSFLQSTKQQPQRAIWPHSAHRAHMAYLTWPVWSAYVGFPVIGLIFLSPSWAWEVEASA